MVRPANRKVAILVAGTLFMELLDGQILSTAAPHMAASLGVAPQSISVAITSYLVTLAVLIPLSGWLSDRFGSRTLFVLAIVVFTTSSMLCATSGDLTTLVCWRVLQGLGGAMMVPVGRLVVLRSTDKADLVRVIALLTWPALVAPVAAPLVGGLLTTYLSWRWIFLVNLPLGVVAGVLAVRVVPQVRRTDLPSLDVAGVVWTSLCLGTAVVAAGSFGAIRIHWTLAAVTGGVSVATAALAARHLLRTREPLLDLRILRIRTFRVSNAGGTVFRITVSAVPFLLPLLFQDGFRWTAVKAGAVVTTLFIGNVGIKPLTTGMLRRYGFRTVIITAVVVLAATMVVMAFIVNTTPLAVIVALLVVSGAARSVGFTAYNTIAFADVESSHLARANTLASTMQTLSIGLGVALGGLALRVGESVARVSSPGASVEAFRVAFIILGVVTAAAAFESIGMPSDAGASVAAGRAATARSSDATASAAVAPD
jgi:EmrB/QacA subfamily drug resistance transporter